MPASIRLDKEIEDILQKTAESVNTTKSEIIRKAIRDYCLRLLREKQRTPWEIYRSIHMPGGSGHGKRVQNSEKILKEHLNIKRKKWSS